MRDHALKARSIQPADSGWMAVALLTAAAVAASEVPLPVSPGGARGVETIGEVCPTFSWTEVREASGYEVAIYEVEAAGSESTEVLRRRLPEGATSWTPSLHRCLERGSRYAWSVRAFGEAATSEWSPPILFRVAAEATETEFEAALRVVERYLAASGGSRALETDEGVDRIEPEDRGAAEETAPITGEEPGEAAVAAPQLTVDGGVVATSFTGDGSTLTALALSPDLVSHTTDADAHHTPTVDTNTNAGTECTAGEYLDGDATCRALDDHTHPSELVPDVIRGEHIDPDARGVLTVGLGSGSDFDCSATFTGSVHGVATAWVGGTDDADCLQAAINVASALTPSPAIELLPGVYSLDTPVTLLPGTEIRGRTTPLNTEAVTLATTVNPTRMIDWSGAANATLRGLSFAYAGAAASFHFIHLPSGGNPGASILENRFTSTSPDIDFILISPNQPANAPPRAVVIEDNFFSNFRGDLANDDLDTSKAYVHIECTVNESPEQPSEQLTYVRNNAFHTVGNNKQAIHLDADGTDEQCKNVHIVGNHFRHEVSSNDFPAIRELGTWEKTYIQGNRFECASTATDTAVMDSGISLQVTENHFERCKVYDGSAIEGFCQGNSYTLAEIAPCEVRGRELTVGPPSMRGQQGDVDVRVLDGSYVYKTSGSNYSWAALPIPEGSTAQQLRCQVLDTTASARSAAALFDCDGTGTCTNVSGWCYSGILCANDNSFASGATVLAPSFTPFERASGHSLHVAYWNSTLGSNLRFYGCTLGYLAYDD